MDKFVPYEKLSKKQKKAADRAKRTVWTMNPVTRKPENPKAYNRRKALYGDHDPGEVLFLFYIRLSCGQIFRKETRYGILKTNNLVIHGEKAADEQLQAGALL